MSMMKVRNVAMLMSDRLMLVHVRMRFDHSIVVLVPMMLVMDVQILMFELFQAFKLYIAEHGKRLALAALDRPRALPPIPFLRVLGAGIGLCAISVGFTSM